LGKFMYIYMLDVRFNCLFWICLGYFALFCIVLCFEGFSR
jgi:hypothetical protein